MKKFLGEFKDFALKGNVIDLAVGVIIGAAFQSIVNSLVKDIISPVIGLIAKTDFSNLSIDIKNVSIRYGSFITAIINFLIMAFIIFLFVRFINKLKEVGSKLSKTEKEKTEKKCPYCTKMVPVKATRCPYCTSVLEQDSEAKIKENELQVEEI